MFSFIKMSYRLYYSSFQYSDHFVLCNMILQITVYALFWQILERAEEVRFRFAIICPTVRACIQCMSMLYVLRMILKFYVFLVYTTYVIDFEKQFVNLCFAFMFQRNGTFLLLQCQHWQWGDRLGCGCYRADLVYRPGYP